MADAKSSVAFARAAVNFEVHESDYLVLCQDKVTKFESMAYRFPQNSDFEEYLKKVVRVRCGYRQDDDQIICFPREDPKPWEDYKMEEDVGCLRKLWNLAIQVSKRQMERMAGEDGDLKAKVTLTTAQELEDKAVESGMPVPASDRDRPSLHTLTKVQGVFGPGGSFQHLPWETYVSMEHEGKLRRAGKIPKDKKEVILEDKKLSLASASDEAELPETRKVDGILALQDVLELRARAYHMLDVAKHRTVTSYHEKIIGFLRATTADGMRGPTLNEARRADREIMNEVLKWVSKGKGSVMAGLAHYANNTDEPLWKFPRSRKVCRIKGWRSIIPAIRRELPLSPGGRRGRRRKIPLQMIRNVDLVCALCARRGTSHVAPFRLDSGRKKRRRGKPLSKLRRAVVRTKRRNRDSSSRSGKRPAVREAGPLAILR